MKRSTVVAFTLVSLFASNCLLASDAIRPYTDSGVSGNFHYAIYNNRWLMRGGQQDETLVAIMGVLPGVEGELSIPEEIDGHQVYGIDENAFEKYEGITSIVIPKTIRFLRPGTLNKCQGLVNIVVADDHPQFASVDGLMFDKKKTQLLVVGNGREGEFTVPEKTTTIGPYAMANCTELKTIIIPAGVTDIGGHTGTVFLGCNSLETIELPDTVTNIGQKSFQDCWKLKEIAIPPKVTKIPFGLFWRCSDLGKITLPDGITSIGNYAFADCVDVTFEALPKSLTTVGAYAFKNCTSIEGLTVPKSVTDIGRGAFQGCDVDIESP